MDELANKLLSKLLEAADKHHAGARSREASLTMSSLKDYRGLNHKSRLLCEESLLAAQSIRCIKVIRDKHNPDDGLIEKIELIDIDKLANFLGKTTLSSKVKSAFEILEHHCEEFPVLRDVLTKWESSNKIRGCGPDTAKDWLDTIKAIQEAKKRLLNDSTSLPIREFSAKLFRDSKRVEHLTVYADVLLADSISIKPRDQNEVWQEVGLFREEQPVLLSGNVIIKRTKVSSYLDEPYSGFKADSILSIVSDVKMLLTIENLTTFHSEAKKRTGDDVLLIYTGGMPSPSWRRMYLRLLNSIEKYIDVYHWGDIDEGGFRIASLISKDAFSCGHAIKPHNMSPLTIPSDQMVKAQESTIIKMKHFCKEAGWHELAIEVEKAGITAEQESI